MGSFLAIVRYQALVIGFSGVGGLDQRIGDADAEARRWGG
jgi:hypothetical protein